MPASGLLQSQELCSARYAGMALFLGEGRAPFMDLLTVDANRRRRLDPQAHAIALDGDHADTDVFSDDNFLPDAARKYKHVPPP